MDKYRPIKPHPATIAKEDKLRAIHPDSKIINLVDAQTMGATAKSGGLWIYDSKLREWHTPDEFIEKYGELPVGSQEFRRFMILDPVEGITAGIKQLNTLQEKLFAFVKKVTGYYQK